MSVVLSIMDNELPVVISNSGDLPVEWKHLSTSVSWLSISPPAGTVPAHGSGSFLVQVNRRAIPEGTHTASLQVMAGGEPHTVQVSVDEGRTAEAVFRSSAVLLGPLDDSTVIEIVNDGGSVLNWSLAPSVPWATVFPASESLAPGATAEVIVTVNRAGLTRGSYTGKLYLTSNGGSSSADLTVQVGDGAGLHLEPAALSFGLSNTQLPLEIVNDGYHPLTWTAEPRASWMSLSSTGGQVPARSTAQVTVSISRTGLSHGLHRAPILFISNGGSAAANVMVNAAPSGSTPTIPTVPAELQISPSALDFGETSVELSLTIHNGGDEPLDWTRETSANWLTVTPAFGRVSPHTSNSVVVRMLRAGLAQGTYLSALRFDSNSGSKTVNVMARVAANPIPDPEPDPGTDPDPDLLPRLVVTPSLLDFGGAETQLSILIQNKGKGSLEWSAQSSKSWLALPVASGQLAPGGSQSMLVRVSRSGLSAAGEYQGSIEITSSGGRAEVLTTLRVASQPPPPGPDTGLNAIDATGKTDVTDVLNAYLANSPDGSVIELPAGATYRAEGVVRLLGKTNITIEGNGALIFATTDGSGVTPPQDIGHLWPRQRSHVEINRSSNIVIRNLRVRGANPQAGAADGAYVEALEGQHGFDVRSVNGLLLDGVTATDTYGDLLYIGGLGDTGWSQNIKVTNSHFERSGRQGIAITAASNVQVLNSYVGDIGRTIIDLEPPTPGGGAQNILFEGNTFGPCRHLLMNSGGRGPNVDDISFIRNHLLDMGLKIRVRPSDDSRRQNYRIIDNISEVELGLPIPAIRFAFVDGIEVRGNYQALREARSMTAVYACESTEAEVTNNEFPGAVKTFSNEAVCPAADD